jgi:hypothetical protein
MLTGTEKTKKELLGLYGLQELMLELDFMDYLTLN